jgi:hypothetical protein
VTLSERLEKANPTRKPEPDTRPAWLRRKEDGYIWRGEFRKGLPVKELVA